MHAFIPTSMETSICVFYILVFGARRKLQCSNKQCENIVVEMSLMLFLDLQLLDYLVFDDSLRSLYLSCVFAFHPAIFGSYQSMEHITPYNVELKFDSTRNMTHQAILSQTM